MATLYEAMSMAWVSGILLADGSDQLTEIARTFGVSWSHLISQVISFSIVCFFLQRFAYRPVLAKLEERRNNIADGLKAADEHRAGLAQSEQERQRILGDTNDEAAKILADVKIAGAQLREEKIKEATDAADQVRIKTQEQMVRERKQMHHDLENEVGKLVVETTASVTGHVMTPDDQQRLLTEAAALLEN